MLWEDKVDEWLAHPVTKVFFQDVERDIQRLNRALVEEDDPTKIFRLQGMVRALIGVMDMPEDGLPNPDKKE